MNVKYQRNKATASRLIRNNGAKFQMKRAIVVTDPVEGNTSHDEFQDIFAVILPPQSGDLDTYLGQMGTLDLSQVRAILISTQGLKWNPLPLHRVFYRGEWWQYEQSSGLDPDGETDILFQGFIRRV